MTNMSLTAPYGEYDLSLEDFLTAKILVEIKKRLSQESASQEKSRQIKGTIEHVTHELTESKGPKQMFMTAGHAIQGFFSSLDLILKHIADNNDDILQRCISFTDTAKCNMVISLPRILNFTSLLLGNLWVSYMISITIPRRMFRCKG